MGFHFSIDRICLGPHQSNWRAHLPFSDGKTPFLGVMATTKDLREECFRLRYQVYCLERGFERPELNPEGLERDAFDEHAVHALLIHRPSGVAVGTVRVVLHDPTAEKGSLPFHSICREPVAQDPALLPLRATAEVSRLAISKERSREAGAYLTGSWPESSAGPSDGHARRGDIALALLSMAVEIALIRDVHYFCAIMESSLLKMLKRFGIHFIPVGPMLRYHGLRQPCYGHILTMLDGVKAERTDVWNLLTDNGRFGNPAPSDHRPSRSRRPLPTLALPALVEQKLEELTGFDPALGLVGEAGA